MVKFVTGFIKISGSSEQDTEYPIFNTGRKILVLLRVYGFVEKSIYSVGLVSSSLSCLFVLSLFLSSVILLAGEGGGKRIIFFVVTLVLLLYRIHFI